MKEKGISRDIGKGRARAADSGHGLGNINRMAVGGPRQERKHRRTRKEGEGAGRDSDSKENHSILVRWTMLFGLLGLVVLALFVMFWLMPFLSEKREVGQKQSKVLTLVEEPEANVLGEREAKSLAKKAMEITDADGAARFIRSESTSPEEILGFLRKLRQEDGEIVGYDWMTQLDTFREDISGVAVTFKKDGEKRNRLALFTPDEEGKWKMDFAAFARSSTPDWSKLTSGAASSAVVRVYVAPDEYFNGPFDDQQGWRCFGIASPDMPELMYGYCLAGSAQEKVLSRLLGDRKSVRATLGIERVEGASNRQFRIKRVLAEDWAIGDVPADEAVK